MPCIRSFADSTFVLGMQDASYFAGDLFREGFGSAFPKPHDGALLSIPTPRDRWHQYVAFYKWSDEHVEPVAFVNFIRFENVYLEGGLCARKNFYRRLPADHWLQCKARGGIAHILLEYAMHDLADADAWFGHTSIQPAWLVNERLGFVATRHPYLKVKWFRELPEERKREIEDRIHEIGSF
ncbi:MAG: hypothetical protein ABI607_09155 [Betaproteobacteria bacterium]